MKAININQLEGKTIGEIIKLSKQAQDLPEGFKIKYKKPKVQIAQELLEELEGGKK